MPKYSDIKTEAKAKRKVQGKIKAKETRENNKKTIKKLENTLTAVKFRKYKKDTKGMSISNRIKWLNKNK